MTVWVKCIFNIFYIMIHFIFFKCKFGRSWYFLCSSVIFKLIYYFYFIRYCVIWICLYLVIFKFLKDYLLKRTYIVFRINLYIINNCFNIRPIYQVPNTRGLIQFFLNLFWQVFIIWKQYTISFFKFFQNQYLEVLGNVVHECFVCLLLFNIARFMQTLRTKYYSLTDFKIGIQGISGM